jgi:hypothetical protein
MTSEQYYYTHWIDALYMDANHGLHTYDGKNPHTHYGIGAFKAGSGPWFVHPGSLGLLQPRVDDIVLIGDDTPALVCPNGFDDGGHEDLRHRCVELSEAVQLFEGDCLRVIQRDGVPFIWPEGR